MCGCLCWILFSACAERMIDLVGAWGNARISFLVVCWIWKLKGQGMLYWFWFCPKIGQFLCFVIRYGNWLCCN